MSAETKRVLDMLAEGKITSADAERLLDKLAATPDSNTSADAMVPKAVRPRPPRLPRSICACRWSGPAATTSTCASR